MRKYKKGFIVYFPVTLVAIQVMINLLSFIDKGLYLSTGFYLNMLFGTNVYFALFLIILTFSIKACSVSKWAAIAECAFAVNYMVIQQDNLYNILFQVIVGVLAIFATFYHFIRKFPLCRLSLLAKFYKKLIKSGCNWNKAFEAWQKDLDNKLEKQYHEFKH